ncbi:E4 SUMO-protein ligase PIAL1-like isoform X2 [Raphanus sativus]|uniref:E4 SUMO-protein ligase PIAL1-like isoform X2 n=1 Tax=Raphanus sativus TaxID=3726 RepID=A0A9W3DBC7_RAPSA|nr:E4 SUMO-protein ligase PIAL1-like isoform X2 [Raphanus sativus]
MKFQRTLKSLLQPSFTFVGQCRCDDQTKAVIMTLMMSVKSACELGWFPQRESQQLLALVDSMLMSFTGPENVGSSLTPNGPDSLIPQVMERFYPFLKLRQILVSSEADSESIVLVKNFHISKNLLQHSPRPRVGLFVFRTDDIGNSSCIIHPQEVSFSLNARAVDNRYINSMDSRPQRPTNVAKLLHPGTNLLQTIGCFGGSYFIAIGLFDDIPLPVYPSLEDYVHSEVIESDSACDIPKGPSRISLSCPISRTRIKLPVKGHACKHLQCCDFWNYIKINTRVPTWCCPHCHQSVCYTDIRLDQSMIKILEEVGNNVTDVVIISPDGSWKVVTENEENVEAVHHHGDSSSSQNLRPDVFLDLTRDENETETTGSTQIPSAAAGGEVIHMPFFPTSSPQDTAYTGNSHISTMPAAAAAPHSSRYQGSSLGVSLGRDSCLMERWNHHNNYAQFHHQYAMQNQRSVSPVQERPIPSSITYPQTFAFNYGRGTSDQRHMQRQNPGGAGEHLSSREFMNLTPDNSANRPPQIRMMRGSIAPGSTRYDHLIIQPTQRPVQSQAQTLPPSQPTGYNHLPVQTQAQALPPLEPTAYSYVPVQSQAQTLPPPPQAFLAHPSNPVGTNETQAGSSSLPVSGDVAPLGSFWSVSSI